MERKRCLTALEFVLGLQAALREKRVTALQFVLYQPSPPAKKRVYRDSSERKTVSEWLQHYKPGPPVRATIRLNGSFERKLLLLIDRAQADGKVVGICSECRRGGSSLAHIPMMDFECPMIPRNRRLLVRGLRKLGQTGALFNSGRPYHFYGNALLTHEQWTYFQAQCLLLGTLTDARYVGHRILQGMSVLRLSSNTTKRKMPTIVARV